MLDTDVTMDDSKERLTLMLPWTFPSKEIDTDITMDVSLQNSTNIIF